MAKIFIDANIYIDWVEQRRDILQENLQDHQLFISPLSIHILVYLYKYKIPNKKLAQLQNNFYIVSINENTVHEAFLGPTNDFEDNIQLHSSTKADCGFFLTEDKKLLKMAFFGKAKIVKRVEIDGDEINNEK